MKFIKYPKVRAIGQDGTEDILTKDRIYVQPKVDGSNVSVYVFGGEPTRVARRTDFITSGARQFGEFVKWAEGNEEAWERIRSDYALTPGEGFILYGEYAWNQNKLKYDEKKPFILFDAFFITHHTPDGQFCDPYSVRFLANMTGCEIIPTIYEGPGVGLRLEELEAMSQRTSFLGGCDEEGIVVKHYDTLTRYNRPYFCKIVTERFKEVQKTKDPQNVATEELGIWIADSFFTQARLEKAIQRMKEDGTWKEENVRSNIGPLIGVVSQDIHEEHWEDIKEYAAKFAWKSGAKKIAAKVSPMLDQIAQQDMVNDVLED